MKRDLDNLRGLIDAIDGQLVDLLNQRAEVARAIGEAKAEHTQPFFTPEREVAVYQRLKEINKGPLSTSQLAAIFREIISAARALEKRLSVAYLGPEGTFSNMAGIKQFGTSSDYLPCDTITDVFQEVERKKVDYGVAPVENSTAGVVPETLDNFAASTVKVCAEVYIQIAHHLVSTANSLKDIKRVYALGQPKMQCRQWLRANLPGIEILPAPSTAAAAELALKDPQSAGITNYLASERYQIPILAEHIEDNPHNRTRFHVIGYNEPKPTGKDKTSIMFTLLNQPGTLYRALGAFESSGVNMTMIESRPAQRSAFEYVFYVDIQGHHTGIKLTEALAKLREFVVDITILGSYPEANDR